MAAGKARQHTVQDATASDSAVVNQAGRDMHIHSVANGGAPRALGALPTGPRELVGRDDVISTVLEALAPGADAVPVAGVCLVVGMAGVGKTALAVHAGRRAADDGWFPGGVLSVELHGYDPDDRKVITGGQAVDRLLRALGIRDADMPPTAEERAALYRSELDRLADQGKPVLVLADDASSPEQVRSLIPARGGHRVLVASRDTLPGIGARVVELETLTPPDAAALITGQVAHAWPGDARVAGDRSGIEAVAGLCGHLPLALDIAAQVLIADPGLALAALAEELRRERDRPNGDGRAARLGPVRAAFAASYRRLSSAAAGLLRLLALNPGPDIATEAVAALAALPAANARGLLAELARSHLLAEQPAGAGRWRMHDLIGTYAADLARADDAGCAGAVDRLLEHYLSTADAADDHLRALPGQQVPDRFTGCDEALAWLDSEHPNLLAAVDLAATTARHATATRLPTCLAMYLNRRRLFDDAITTGQTAVTTARELGDRHGEGTALIILGIALQQVRRFKEAIDAHQQATAIFQELGDRHGEDAALNNLGLALRQVRRFEEAIDAHQQAATICRELGDRHCEGMALNNLGSDLTEVRQFEEAIDAHQRATAIFQELGDRHGESAALNNLGLALRQVRRFEEAIAAHQQAATICRELGDRHREGMALNNLGVALREVRRFEEAIAAHWQDLAIDQELGDRHGEGVALNNLGLALREVRRFEEAIDAHQQAATIFQELGDRHNEGMALSNLGAALTQVRRFDEAIDAHQQATAIFQELGDRHSEGMALNNLDLTLADAQRAARRNRLRLWGRWRVRRQRTSVRYPEQSAETRPPPQVKP